MQQGQVKFFNVEKGYGFIAPSTGGNDVFVNTSGLIDDIRENDRVTYELYQSNRGVYAINVKLA